jgi:hypothetical protein
MGQQQQHLGLEDVGEYDLGEYASVPLHMIHPSLEDPRTLLMRYLPQTMKRWTLRSAPSSESIQHYSAHD